MKNDHELTEGRIYPVLIRFAFPVLGALFLQSLYGAVDLLVVGRFSTSSDVAAVSNGAQIMTTLTNVMASLAMGTTILLGHRIGQKDREGAGRIIGASIMFFTILGAAASVLLAVFAPGLARIMKVPDEAMAAATAYLRICGGGMLIITWYNLIGSIFRAVGDSVTPLIAVSFACVGNIVGDLLLVGVFHMGAAGAAIATVLGTLAGAGLSCQCVVPRDPCDCQYARCHSVRRRWRGGEGLRLHYAGAERVHAVDGRICLAELRGGTDGPRQAGACVRDRDIICDRRFHVYSQLLPRRHAHSAVQP